MAALYRRVLGEVFDSLPPALYRFHDLEGGGRAAGVVRVTRGKGWVRNGIASLLRLPSQGTSVRLQLEVSAEGNRERWRRTFNGAPMQTCQWAHHGWLVETAGPFRLGYRLAASREGLRFDLQRAWFYFLPLPPAMAPKIQAVATGRQDGWSIRVRAELPVVGLLVQYEGEMVPLCSPL
jgi:hypothetical protein